MDMLLLVLPVLEKDSLLIPSTTSREPLASAGLCRGTSKHRLSPPGLPFHWILSVPRETELPGGHHMHHSECPRTVPPERVRGAGKGSGVFVPLVLPLLEHHRGIWCEGPSPLSWCWLEGCHKPPQVWCPVFRLVSLEEGNHIPFPSAPPHPGKLMVEWHRPLGWGECRIPLEVLTLPLELKTQGLLLMKEGCHIPLEWCGKEGHRRHPFGIWMGARTHSHGQPSLA